jgi:predicted helicase
MAAAVGISIMFLVKQANRKMPCKILYLHPCDIRATRIQKFEFLQDTPFEKIEYLFQEIEPDKKGNWIHQTDNDFDSLMPLVDKNAKAGKEGNAIFKLFSRGVETGRDEWVYDFNIHNLIQKNIYFSQKYNHSIDNNQMDYSIKWSSSLESSFKAKKKATFDEDLILKCMFRPFSDFYFYSESKFNHRLTKNHYDFFGCDLKQENIILSFNGIGIDRPFSVLANNHLVDIQLMPNGQTVCLFTYDKNGAKQENITDWALQQFTQQYNNQQITKEQIFYYVYAVLHAPAYRTAYEQNLKRDFPRIPFYADFNKYAAAGKQLADLHIGYETVAPYPLKVVEVSTSTTFTYVPKAKLKADKTNHCIEIDDITKLCGVPEAAWDYKLGNRSALEWVLDQYKESKPTDKTILEHFNTYRFANYKEKVIELLMRVCRVSVETVQIIEKL